MARLWEIIKEEEAVFLEFSGPARAISLYRRLQNLKRQKEALEKKHGFVFRDSDGDLIIEALETKIKRVRTELQEAKKGGEEQK